MEMKFDSVFCGFVLPSVFCGELSCSSCDVHDAHDCEKLVRHIVYLSSNTHRDADPQEVRSISVRHCVMQKIPPRVVEDLAGCLCRFVFLRKLVLDGCRLGERGSAAVLRAVSCMNQVCADDSADFELGMQENGITDATVSTLAQLPAARGGLVGVSKLSLVNNPLGDSSLLLLAEAFPRLRALHLSSTKLRGASIKAAVCKLESLALLDVDCTPLGQEAPGQLLAVASHRVRRGVVAPLEVWARDTGPCDDSWCGLLSFVCKPQNTAVSLKHDLLQSGVARPRHVPLLHEVVKVSLHVHGLPMVALVHENVPSTKPVLQMAEEVVCLLNLVAMGDDSAVRDRVVMQRRIMYRSVLDDHFKSGEISGKVYKLGVVQLHCTNRFTGETLDNLSVGGMLLGAPRTRGGLRLVVEAEEDRRKERGR